MYSLRSGLDKVDLRGRSAGTDGSKGDERTGLDQPFAADAGGGDRASGFRGGLNALFGVALRLKEGDDFVLQRLDGSRAVGPSVEGSRQHAAAGEQGQQRR